MLSFTLTHLRKLPKSTRFALDPEGNGLIFRLSPFRVGAKKSEKSNPGLICQSRIRWLLITAIFCFSLTQTRAQNIDSLIQQTKSEIDTVRLLTYLKLAGTYRNTDIDSSNIFLKKARKEILADSQSSANKIPEHFKGYYYRQKGINYQFSDSYDSALHYYEKALAIFEKNSLDNKQTQILINLGALHEMQGNYVRSLKIYFDILDFCDSTNQMKEKSKVLNNIALIYNNQSKYENALKYYNMALELKKELGLKRGQALIYNNIGITYYYLGKYDKVLEFFKRSLNIYREINDIRSQAMPYFNIAEIYSTQGNYKEALYFYKKSYDIEKKLDNKAGEAETLKAIGAVYKELNKFDDAIRVQKEAAKILKPIGAKRKLSGVYQELSDTYKSQAKYKLALQYYELYTKYKDSVYSLRKNEQITQIKEKYESNKKDKKIALLEQQAKIAQLESEKQKAELESRQQMTILSLFVAALGLLALAMIYRLYSQKKLSNQLLSVKNQEISNKNTEISRGYRHYEQVLHNIQRFYNKALTGQHQSLCLIYGVSDLLKPGHKPADIEIDFVAAQIHHAAQYLLHKSENIIAANEIANTRLQPNYQAVNMKEMTAYMKEQFNNSARQNGVNIVFRTDDTCPENFLTDPGKYSLILSNLIEHAILHTKKNNTIEILFSCEEQSLLKASLICPAGSINDKTKDAFYQISLKNRETIFELDTPPAIEFKIVKYFTDALRGNVFIETLAEQHEKITVTIPVEPASKTDFQFAYRRLPTLAAWLKKRNLLYVGTHDKHFTELKELVRIVEPETNLAHCKHTDEVSAMLNNDRYGIVFLHNNDLNAANQKAKQIKSKQFDALVFVVIGRVAENVEQSAEDNNIDGTLYWPFDILQIVTQISHTIINNTDERDSRITIYESAEKELQNKDYLLSQLPEYINILNGAIRNKNWSEIVDAVSNLRKQLGSGAGILKEELDLIERECVTTNNAGRVEEALVSIERKYKKLKEEQ